MSAVESAREWHACVCNELLPELHKHQSKVPADLSFTFLAAGAGPPSPASNAGSSGRWPIHG